MKVYIWNLNYLISEVDYIFFPLYYRYSEASSKESWTLHLPTNMTSFLMTMTRVRNAAHLHGPTVCSGRGESGTFRKLVGVLITFCLHACAFSSLKQANSCLYVSAAEELELNVVGAPVDEEDQYLWSPGELKYYGRAELKTSDHRYGKHQTPEFKF